MQNVLKSEPFIFEEIFGIGCSKASFPREMLAF